MKKLTTLLFCAAIPLGAAAKVNVVTSTSDLAYFARAIGGDRVAVSFVAPPSQDPHFVDVRPSFMMKVRKADVALKVGLELDLWMDKLIDGSRNADVIVVDCSEHIQPLDIPSGKVDASAGDLHRFGNPHYWMSPDNAAAIIRSISDGLSQAAPEFTAEFDKRADSLRAHITTGAEEIKQRANALVGLEAVFYHKSWIYFNEFFGVKAVGFVEPFPGVPPSPSQMKRLRELIDERDIRVIAVDVYFDDRAPQKLAEETLATVIELKPSVGSEFTDETYLEWLSRNVEAFLEALQ